MSAPSNAEEKLARLLGGLQRAADATTTWVTQLSWWKFLLFAMLAMIAASIVQDELFSASENVEIKRDEGRKAARLRNHILIDENGINFNPAGADSSAAKDDSSADSDAASTSDSAAAGTDEAPAKAEAPAAKPAHPAAPAAPTPPAAPAAPTPPEVAGADSEVHIPLPPQIGRELSDAIQNQIDDAAEQRVSSYHKQASTWFRSFVLLLVIVLFGTKALVGGKKRAEAETQSANAAVERESMQRQLSEAKMQMMQAQVEPHFLFNTLASVEHLIQTDPPRAANMQRSLIQYLRAVLPQMRDNAVVTNLGREADMVAAYLDLLKMRMEERLTVELQIPDGLRTAAFPPMMLQSMVENAIKHGLECKPEGGTLRVLAEVAHSKLRVTVSDDGVGFGVVPSDGTGLGLPTIRERLKLLFGEHAQLLIAANSPSGVIATVEVPYQLAK